MPSPAPEPLAPRPLSVWLVNPFDDIPGEGFPPLRCWTLARVLTARGHDVTWWTATWSHRRKAIRTMPLGLREDEGFAVRLVSVQPYETNASFARLGSQRDFGRNFERLANEAISAGHLERPDIILASLPPLESAEAAARLAERLDATFVLDLIDAWPENSVHALPGPAFLRRLVAPLVLRGLTKRRQALVAAADAACATTITYAETVLRSARESLPRHVCHVGAYPQEFTGARRHAGPAPSPADAPNTPPPALECVCSGAGGRDVDVLVAATRQLSAAGVHAVIHVTDAGARETALRQAAVARTGSCRLEVHGRLTRPAFVSLLGRCDVGIVGAAPPDPGAPVPDEACEYVAAGLALVNGLPGELQSLVDEHGAGVPCSAGDAAALARAITALATDRPRLGACRQGARRLAAAMFDRERTYPRFADWLETVSG